MIESELKFRIKPQRLQLDIHDKSQVFHLKLFSKKINENEANEDRFILHVEHLLLHSELAR